MSKLEVRFNNDLLMSPHVPRGWMRQHVFAKSQLKRHWAFDFAWSDQKIAVEIQGGTFAEHNRTGSLRVLRRSS